MWRKRNNFRRRVGFQ